MNPASKMLDIIANIIEDWDNGTMAEYEAVFLFQDLLSENTGRACVKSCVDIMRDAIAINDYLDTHEWVHVARADRHNDPSEYDIIPFLERKIDVDHLNMRRRIREGDLGFKPDYWRYKTEKAVG